MIRRTPQGAERLLVLWPGLLLLLFFLVPFGIMVAVSVAHRVEGGFYEFGFDLGSYRQLLTALFGRVLIFSLAICATAAALAVALAFPFVWFLLQRSRRTQVAILVLLLSVLSLSEVMIGFSWSILLSRTAGLSNLLVWVGLLDQPQSWSPSFAALLLGLVWLALPYAVLVLFPSVARLDPELPEAARTLGATPVTTFRTVIVPALREAIVAAFIMVFVFTLGSYLLPQILGQPEHWTLSVLITDQAIYQSNLPFGAAMAIFLMVVSLGLVALTARLGQGRRFQR
jgi:putative spermidine/putrescine transport system permease protein